MNLILTRRVFLPNCTIGTLEIVADENPRLSVYFCDTLEPTYRDLSKEKKVKGKTAIPYGCYKLEFRRSSKFGKIMPYLKAVPHFYGIMIHPGNSPKETQGCILVGRNPEGIHTGLVDIYLPRVDDSRKHFERLSELLRKARDNGEDIFITIKDTTL